MNTYLITGGSGFVGRHLITQLQKNDQVERIAVLIRKPSCWEEMEWTAGLNKVTLVEGDLDNVDQWQQHPALDSLAGIFHLAAMVAHNRRERDAVFHCNVSGSVNLASLAKQRAVRLVYVSTSGTVGCFKDPDKTVDESAEYAEPRVSNWPYYASKIAAEKALLDMSRQGLELVILRPPIMLGPGDHRYRSTGILLKFLNRKLPMVIRGGFPMVDVRDAAAAMLKAMFIAAPKPIYHLPGDQPTIDELFAMLESLSGVKAPTLHLPEGIVLALARFDEWLGLRIKGEPLGLVPDPVVIEMGTSYWGLKSQYAADDLDFNSRPALETLTDTLAWLKANPPASTH